jgi:hypothetical protein
MKLESVYVETSPFINVASIFTAFHSPIIMLLLIVDSPAPPGSFSHEEIPMHKHNVSANLKRFFNLIIESINRYNSYLEIL